MKSLLRRFLITLGALWITTRILPSILITGGARGLIITTLAFMLTDLLLIPLIKILLLPLNLLTLGLFAWVTNVLALYFLVSVIPNVKVLPFSFPGVTLNGFIVPAVDLSTFQVVVVASLLIGAIIHFVHWLIK